MNHDLALIAAVLDTRDYAEAVRNGAESKLFGDESLGLWEMISEHYDRFHEVPSLELFQQWHPNYVHVPPEDSIAALVHELKSIRLCYEIDRALEEVAELNVTEPWEAKSKLMMVAESINLLNREGNTDLMLGEDGDDVLAQISQLQVGGGLLGIPWPWDYLNERSRGIEPENFIYFYGREKSKKTFILCMMALWWISRGYRVLFVTREMGKLEISWRMYALLMGIDFGRWNKGDITKKEKLVLAKKLKDLRASQKLVISEVRDGILGLKAKVEEVKPHIIIHDYFKAMADDAMASRANPKQDQYVARLADQLKDYAHEKKIPIIACGHANRKGIAGKGTSSEEHAWSDHIVRKVDYAFRVINDGSEDRIALIVNAGRSVKQHLALTINGDLGADFGKFVDDDISWVATLDTAQNESKKSKNRKNVKPPKGATKGKLEPKKNPFRRT